MVSVSQSPASEGPLTRTPSRLRIYPTLSENPFPSVGGMDIADVKLHKLVPMVIVKEMPSSPASVSSADSFSSVSSRTSNYKAIYPPGGTFEEETMDSMVFGTSPKERRIGSIDQLIEWNRNVSNESLAGESFNAQSIPPSGNECPLLMEIPAKVMNLCSCSWGRIQQRMNVQLLCRGVKDCSKMGLYEIASGMGQGTYVAVVILYARSISKAGILEQRMREIADQEWKDIPPIRVWWVDEEPGMPISVPMANKESIVWNPIRFKPVTSRSTSASSYLVKTGRTDSQGQAPVSSSSSTNRPNFQRRHSSAIALTPGESPTSESAKGDLLTDELDSKLRSLIMCSE